MEQVPTGAVTELLPGQAQDGWKKVRNIGSLKVFGNKIILCNNPNI